MSCQLLSVTQYNAFFCQQIQLLHIHTHQTVNSTHMYIIYITFTSPHINTHQTVNSTHMCIIYITFTSPHIHTHQTVNSTHMYIIYITFTSPHIHTHQTVNNTHMYIIYITFTSLHIHTHQTVNNTHMYIIYITVTSPHIHTHIRPSIVLACTLSTSLSHHHTYSHTHQTGKSSYCKALLLHVHRPFMNSESCVPVARPPLLFMKFSEQWSMVIAKLCYASSAWWCFSMAGDIQQITVFIHHSIRKGYCTTGLIDITSIIDTADHTLFCQILTNPDHVTSSPKKLTRTTN